MAPPPLLRLPLRASPPSPPPPSPPPPCPPPHYTTTHTDVLASRQTVTPAVLQGQHRERELSLTSRSRLHASQTERHFVSGGDAAAGSCRSEQMHVQETGFRFMDVLISFLEIYHRSSARVLRLCSDGWSGAKSQTRTNCQSCGFGFFMECLKFIFI